VNLTVVDAPGSKLNDVGSILSALTSVRSVILPGCFPVF